MQGAPNAAGDVSGAGVATAPISAILVTFNSEDVIAESLLALHDCQNVEQIIVVDNASSDRTVSLISAKFPNVEILVNPENIGFGPANNLGLGRVRNEFVLTLNPDALVTPAAVATLVQVAAEHANAAIVGPLLQRPGKTRPRVRTGDVWNPQKISVPADSDREVEFLSGAAMLMRMSLVGSSGFFDPELFLFYEDDDICRSARRAGYSLILTSKATVTHLTGRSTAPHPDLVAFKQCHFTWSRLYLEEKAHGGRAALILARRTLRKLPGKKLLARLLRDERKLQVLSARFYAVQCFLHGQAPSTIPHDFVKRIAGAGVRRPGNAARRTGGRQSVPIAG